MVEEFVLFFDLQSIISQPLQQCHFSIAFLYERSLMFMRENPLRVSVHHWIFFYSESKEQFSQFNKRSPEFPSAGHLVYTDLQPFSSLSHV